MRVSILKRLEVGISVLVIHGRDYVLVDENKMFNTRMVVNTANP